MEFVYFILAMMIDQSNLTPHTNHARIQRGDRRSGPPPPPHLLQNHKNVGFLSNTAPDSQNNNKTTKPAFNIRPSSARQPNAIIDMPAMAGRI